MQNIIDQLTSLGMTIADLVVELNQFENQQNKQPNKKPRQPRTTLSTYKRYNLDIPYKLHSIYKAKYGELIQWDGTNWYYIGQLSTMPHCLKKIRV